jgi:hypothetical protein
LNGPGDERVWWKGININPLPIAMKLWKHGRTDAPNVAKLTMQISQPVLAAEIHDRGGLPTALKTAPADGGRSE